MGRQVDVNVDGGDNKDNVVGSLLQNFSYKSIQSFKCCNIVGPPNKAELSAES